VLGHPLGHGQRYKRAAKADHRRKYQEAHIVDPVGGQMLVHPQNPYNNAQNNKNSNVGYKKKQHSFHFMPSSACSNHFNRQPLN
jgi:hypothetical protein